MKKRLTVAHYKENLSWVNQINENISVYIYHKEDNQLNYDQKQIINEKEFILRNVGREAHTYIKHIVDNYDKIYDLEFFSQGSPDNVDNYPGVVNSDTNCIFEQYVTENISFISTNGYITEHMKQGGCETRDIWDNLFNYPPPNEVLIKPFAMLKIPKEYILMHDKEIYIKCLEYFNDNNKDNINAWNFEYFWALLFHKIHLNKKI